MGPSPGPPHGTPRFDPRLLDGLSIYQDVVVAGQRHYRGRRNCAARWELIRPALVGARTLLDVGSNFGWFPLAACRDLPGSVVASVEADRRSAAVQRAVLAANAERRIALLTARAGPALAARWAAAGQRFDAALCLSVLHWMRRPRAFLERLGAIAGRIVVEHPHPAEPNAGLAAVRRQMGPIGPYLGRVFPHRRVTLLGTVDSHLAPGCPREIWLVDTAPDGSVADGLDVATLLDLDVAWPERAWWQRELASTDIAGHTTARFTAEGLAAAETELKALSNASVRRGRCQPSRCKGKSLAARIERMPADGLPPEPTWPLRQLGRVRRAVVDWWS